MRTAKCGIFFCALSLLSLGLVMLWDIDAVATRERWQCSHFFWRQLGWIGLGLPIMLLVARQDYKRWRKFVFPVFGVAVAMFFVPSCMRRYVPGMGWATVIGGISFWPAELCVIATVLCLANCLAYWQENAPQTQPSSSHAAQPTMSGLATCLLLFGVFWLWGLVILATNSSSVLLLAVPALIILWLGGARRWLVATCYGGIAVGYCCWLRCNEPRWTRFIDSYRWQFEIAHCRPLPAIALSRGGWLGVGLGNGRVSGIDDPAWATDFMGTVIGEELGCVARICLVLVYAALIGAGLLVSLKARDDWGFLLGLGITSLIGVQALINLAVVTSLIPLRAPALPFVSYAGGDLVMMLACVGLLLSIAKHSAVGAPADSGRDPGTSAVLPPNAVAKAS
jgi:cell division protein FtsW